MKEIIIGLIAGIIGGMGMGGGTVLILLLTIFLGVEQHIAQASNVIFFVPTAIAAIIIFIKRKTIKFKIGIPIFLWGLGGALIGAIISSKMQVGLLRKLFGIFLLLIAIYQIYSLYRTYIKAKKSNNIINN